jgi:hypothetical protein
MSAPPQNPPPPSDRPAIRKTNTGNQRVLSAARATPMATPAVTGPLKEKLKSEAENLGLNAVGTVKDLVTDFRASNRFFKYKVFIVAAWLALSIAGLVVAWPESGPSNSMGAKLYQPEAGSNVFMIKNEGENTWSDVIVVVNNSYRLSVESISPLSDVTFSPKQLIGADGKVAPTDMRVVDITLKIGRRSTKLYEHGRAVE